MDKLVSLVQAARLRLPVLRDLRRHSARCWDYGPLGVELKQQRQGPLVARDGARARRHRGPRRRDPHAPARLGGLRPRRGLHRSAGGLQDVQGALPRRQARRRALPAEAAQDARRACRVRAHRAAPVQPDVQDVHGAGRGGRGASSTCGPRRRRASTSTSRTCCTSSRQKVPFGIAQIGKAFRNEITPGQLHLPHARVRADGDAVLRQARHRRRSGSSTGASERMEWYHDARHPPERSCAGTSTAQDELAHYAKAAYDIEYEFPFGWQELEGIHNRTDFDLGAAPGVLAARSSSTSTRQTQRALPARTSSRPRRAPTASTLAVLVDAYREEEVEGETRVVLRLPPDARADQGGVFPLVKKDGMPEIARRDLPTSCARRFNVVLRRERRDRPALPPHGRGRHAVLHHGRPARRSRTRTVTVRDRDYA